MPSAARIQNIVDNELVKRGIGFGNVFYVSSTQTNAANSTGRGLTPETALASIHYASTQCTASNGDVIVVLPYHVETITAAAGCVLAKAGVYVLCIGEGVGRPQIQFTTANTADLDIDAAGVTIDGALFVAGFADVAAAIDVNATDFTVRKCLFRESAANLNAVIWIQDATSTTSSRITIEDCHCIDADAANTHFVNFSGTGDGHIVRRNILIGDWGTACIGGAGVVTNTTVTHNLISNQATDNDSCIKFAATATGIVMHNHACGGAAQANGITATAMALSQNYYGVVSEDLSAILDPIAT